MAVNTPFSPSFSHCQDSSRRVDRRISWRRSFPVLTQQRITDGSTEKRPCRQTHRCDSKGKCFHKSFCQHAFSHLRFIGQDLSNLRDSRRVKKRWEREEVWQLVLSILRWIFKSRSHCPLFTKEIYLHQRLIVFAFMNHLLVSEDLSLV